MIKLLLLMLEIISFGLVSLGTVTSTYSYEETPSYDHKTLITLETQFEELNNHTLAEVFEDGNLLSDWNYNGLRHQIVGDYIEIDAQNDVQFAYQYIQNGSSNDLWFTNFITQRKSGSGLIIGIFPYNSQFGSLSLPMSDVQNNAQIVDIDYYYSNITTTTNNGISILMGRNSNPIGKTWFIALNAINLTALGISDLTVEQMDFYYSLYQDCVNNVDNYIYTTYDFTPSEITFNDLLIIALSLGLWAIIFKLIRGLLP